MLLDDFTHYVWTITLKFKSQVYLTLLHFYAYVKTQFERPIKSFQIDHGREFDNNNFKQFCLNNGMVLRFSCPHTSSQNGKAERMLRTLNNIKRTLLFHASLPHSFTAT